MFAVLVPVQRVMPVNLATSFGEMIYRARKMRCSAEDLHR
jgi:hypothetical protein